MTNEKNKPGITPSKKDTPKEPTKHKEQVPRKHPHGKEDPPPEQIPREHPHDPEVPVADKKNTSAKAQGQK